MKILIDTNVILDKFLRRDPFYNDSNIAILNSLKNNFELYLSCSAITDIYYLARKQYSYEKAIGIIGKILIIFKLAAVDEECIFNAFTLPIKDFEDAVIISVAKKINADLILTRNIKDYINSDIKVVDPHEYNKIIS